MENTRRSENAISATAVGALRTFGDHKGSGLALMCEILGGALSGTGCTSPGRKFANGMFSLYVDPARMDLDGMFPKDVTRYPRIRQGSESCVAR